ncbi:MAG: cytochrome D1 domain-containing protein [Planctomycetota bacterium]
MNTSTRLAPSLIERLPQAMRAVTLGALFLAVAACGGRDPAKPGIGTPASQPASKPAGNPTGTAAANTLPQDHAEGRKLYESKGCVGCHSLDGTPRVGPSLLGLMGRKTAVTTAGAKRELTADEAYVRKSITDPNADVVDGFIAGQMPPLPVTPAELDALVAMIQALKPGAPVAQPVIASAVPQKGHEVVLSKGCVGCHSLDGSPRVGPSFLHLFGKKEQVLVGDQEQSIVVDAAYVRESILDPAKHTVKGFTQGLMPNLHLSNTEIDSVVELLKALETGTPDLTAIGTPLPGKAGGPPPLSSDEMAHASDIFFNRCGGCHGMLRKGATGPALTPEKRTLALGTEGLKTFINYGSPKGMPAWGKNKILSESEVDLLARFLQHEPPPPPEMSLEQIRATWRLTVPVEQRPTAPQHTRNWQNFFGVVLRDAGKVAIVDGDTKELVNIVETGFAVHILRSSADGRYFISIGRDGKVTMIDLWMAKPDMVAEVKACYEARSVDASKYSGELGDYRDKYLVVGGYWPPALTILDGRTLEPKKLIATSGYTCDDNEFLREARVAAIVASHERPEWVVNIKETGHMWMVDYSDIENVDITSIACDRFLHDGGWDASKRYVLMAANARNRIAVVDTHERKRVALVDVGATPHPGRGANIDHPKYGPIWCTGHLGENTIACIGTDPENHPDQAWKVVHSVKLPGDGGGNLFIKTHPNSRYLWADRVLHPDLHRNIYVIDKVTLEVVKTLTIPSEYPGRAVHIEYDKAGKEAWVSAWSPMDQRSAVLVYDDETLELKHQITGDWMVTPTGHFNVHNTMHDIY